MGRLATWWVTTLVAAAVAVPSYAAPVPGPSGPSGSSSERTHAVPPSVGIRVRPSIVDAGRPVALTGMVRHVAPRSQVRLEIRTAGGWRRVGVDRTNRFGGYGFRTVPPRGDSTFRVLLPRRTGQSRARSQLVTVRATWTPALTLTAVSYDAAAGGGVVTRVVGAAPELGGVLLERQRRPVDGAWAAAGSALVSGDGSWADTVTSEPGWQLRWVAPAGGARQAAATSDVTVAALPTPPAPDPDPAPQPTPDPSPTPDPTPDPDPDVAPTLTAIATHYPSSGFAQVVGTSTGLTSDDQVQREVQRDGGWTPEGAPVGVEADGRFSDVFRIELGLSYRYVVPAAGERAGAVSDSFGFASPGPRSVPLDATTSVTFQPGQRVLDLVVDLQAGQRWTWVGTPVASATLVPPTGEPVLLSGDAVTRTADRSGDHTIRLTREDLWSEATGSITLSTPRVVPAEVDEPARDLVSSLPGQLVEMAFDGDAGSVVSEYARPPETGALPRSTPTLIAPSGDVVPRWGRLQREGHVWRLPETGAYTLRFTPGPHDVVDRPGQVVLSARVADVSLDRTDRISLEQPGRVAVVRTTVPAGLTVTLSDDGPAHLLEELFGPDGEPIDTYTTSPKVSPTVAGTYTQLVSYPFGPTGARYFASAPGTLTATVDGPLVTYDLGGVPDASTLVRVPITTAEQVFSVEVLDADGELCGRRIGFVDEGPLWTMVSQNVVSPQYPPVLWTYRTGDLVMSVNPCDDTGRIRVVTAVVAPEMTPVPTPLGDDDTLWTTDVDIAVSTPGQVTVVPYDAGPSVTSDRVDVSFADSSFAADTLFHVGWSRGDSAGSTGGHPGTAADFWLSTTFLWDEATFFVYAGPRATGTATLRVERYDW
ncbi:hypothetical protein IEZ26_02600 [Nocardioides cavernae]|uniref:Uncharacterized protein n=1 Tax=Nocardioides cavernae TaxID=1921566 RepID=A0ABR8N7G0_9ACTN|nr:hypothetical protein [Nocardioides cavernae]MBD3923497.1 hypothetical protein [Nocardioides cavernae]MBM7511576.1 hypothetical protein [Nocardioides cavernae]